MTFTLPANPSAAPSLLEPRAEALAERAGQSAPSDAPGLPGFSESLTASLERDEDEQAAEAQEAREAAQQLVASAFLQPMLKELREGGFRADFLEPGPGRDAFEQRLHTRLADEMVERMDLPIVDAVTRFVSQSGKDAPADAGGKVDRHG